MSLDKDIKNDLKKLAPAIISSKIELQKTLVEAASESGVRSVNAALAHAMKVHKVGFRTLVLETGIKKRTLKGIVDGTIPLSPEDNQKIHAVFAKRVPSLFK